MMTNAMAPTESYGGVSEASAEMPKLGSPQGYRIRRRGARPLTFHGTELAMAMSFSPELPYWYEINIYRAGTQGFALAIRQFFQSEAVRDRVDAWRFDTMDAVLAHLEAYDAARDVAIGAWPAADAPPAALAAAALEIKAEVSAARQHFAGLVGELLSEIDGVAEAV